MPVGAKLLFSDDRVQHAGVVVGLGGVAGHARLGAHRGDHGYFGRANLVQNVSAVTGACMMVRRDAFERMRGFDETLAVAFNDVDLCLRMRESGYSVIYTPYAALYHHESRSRGCDHLPDKKTRFERETQLVQERWAKIIGGGDPYYNPNLDDRAERNFRLRSESPDSPRAPRSARFGDAANPRQTSRRPR